MLKPELSVIVAVYNVEKYLDECLRSIVDQTMKNIEIIIINDGSTDNSVGICNKYKREDLRIRLISKSNEGLVSARKEGLNSANGKYIFFVDGDDYLDVDACEKMYQAISNSQFDFVHFNYRDNNGNEICNITYEEVLNLDCNNRKELLLNRVLYNREGNYITPSIWSKIFEVDFIKKVYAIVPNEQSYGEDVITLCMAFLNGNKIGLSKEIVYNYRVRNDSMSHRVDWNNLYNTLGLMVALKKNMPCDYHADIEKFVSNIVLNELKEIDIASVSINRWIYKDYTMLLNKKIILYGAGEVGQDYYMQLSKYNSINIVAWVDSDGSKVSKEYCHVDEPNVIFEKKYDYILIAIRNHTIAKLICDELICKSVDKEKIIWSEPVYQY